MTALWFDDPETNGTPLHRDPLGGARSERWLQDLLYDHPELVPMERIEPGAGAFIPVCKELILPGNVRLDLFGVTPHGRPVLIECKLWRNPQARREVIAQLLEYAGLLARLTYADLTSGLNVALASRGENPLFERVRDRLAGLEEHEFVDAVVQNLRAGDFHLIIAGDGIRENVRAIADQLEGRGARLALVEFQVWTDASDRTLVIPHIPFRAEVVRQRLLVDQAGARVQVDEPEEAAGPAQPSAYREAARAFWQRFIDEVRFDHADQPAPRHGGHGWVRIPMPAPAKWLSAYQYDDRIGIYLTWDSETSLYSDLEAQADALREETELPLVFSPDSPFIGIWNRRAELGDEDAQIEWLCNAANRLVSALRPRLALLQA